MAFERIDIEKGCATCKYFSFIPSFKGRESTDLKCLLAVQHNIQVEVPMETACDNFHPRILSLLKAITEVPA